MTTRLMTLADLQSVLGWAAAEGWNPGLDDAPAFRSADPGGFFVTLREGAPVAAISVVNHDPATAFLGLYLCRPEWRGQGIGLALWRHALRHAGGRSIGLDGVAAQQDNYARSGFRREGATLRWEGALRPEGAPDIRLANSGDEPALLALDRVANGYARPAFLTAWLAAAPTRRTVVLMRGADPVGFATLRLCGRGAKIGPLLAPDAAAALRLTRAALALQEARPVILDVPEANAALCSVLQAEGLVETFRTVRMWKGPPPATSALLQAAGTLELG